MTSLSVVKNLGDIFHIRYISKFQISIVYLKFCSTSALPHIPSLVHLVSNLNLLTTEIFSLRIRKPYQIINNVHLYYAQSDFEHGSN